MYIALITLFIVICFWIRRNHRKNQEPIVWKSFVEKMAKDGRLWDENGTPLYNVTIESMTGNFGRMDLAKDLATLYNDETVILRIVNNQLKVDHKPIEIHITITEEEK